MRTVLSWRAVLTVTLGLAGMAACTSDEASDDESTASTSTSAASTSVAAATTIPATTQPATTLTPTTAATSTTSAAATTAPSTATSELGACTAGQSALVSAFDRASGAPGWSVCTTADVQPSLVGATDELVYAVLIPQLRPQPESATPDLVALDAVTGTERWRVELPEFGTNVAGPQAGTDVLVAVLGELGSAALVGLDAATGTERWRVPLTREPALLAASADVVVAHDPGAFGEPSGGSAGRPPATVLGDDPRPGSGELAAYSAFARTTGAPLWTTKLLAPDNMRLAGPSRGEAGDGIAVVPLGPSALDLTDGQIVWTATLPPGPVPIDPSLPYAIGPVRGGTALFGGLRKRLIAVDAATGQQRWTSLGSTVYDDVWAVDDTSVYLVDGADIVANDLATGAERWRQPQGDGYLWPWLAGDGDVFTMWWNLEARSADTGEVRWHTDFPTASSPTDGTRIVTAAMNAAQVLVGFSSGTQGGD